MKKKILLIPNMPNWSLDKIARNLVKHNTSDLAFEIVHFDDFIGDWENLYEGHDLLFPMTNRLFHAMLGRDIPPDRSVTLVTSFASWDGGKTVPPGFNVTPPRGEIRALKKALLVSTSCRKLWHIFSKHLPVINLTQSCDLKMFYPAERKRASDHLVVGWAGSVTNNENLDTDLRGIGGIIKPACAAVDGVEFLAQFAEVGLVTDDNEMRDYYNSLDLYLCASKSEGTPMTMLEAAACGVPALTTDVGMVPELIEEGVNGVVVERTVEAFAGKLEYFVKHRELLKEMGRAARARMEREFSWERLVDRWTEFFYMALELRELKRKGHIRG
jgi:glycosyltransferase involved in cell wall biosynthesis